MATKNEIAQAGLSARITLGSATILDKPSTASTPNQSIITGPNSLPTLAVPRRWMMNRKISTMSANGITKGLNAGVTTSSPSTAESTETAGVIAPSP